MPTDIEQPLATGATDVDNQRRNEKTAASAGYLVYKNSTTPGKQEVVGPDGKTYKFSKNISENRIEKYFTKQGWVKGKDGKWLTASGESTDRQTPSSIPAVTPSKSGKGTGVGLVDVGKIKKDSAATDYTAQALPSVGGAVGGILGGTPGAAIGGAAGEGLKIVARGILLNEDISNKKAAIDVATEAFKQAGLQKVGEIGGELFFKALSKIPHAAIKNGIKLLPSETGQYGKITRYVEDLLGNLAPSAEIMEKFKAGQSAEITNKIDTFAQGMARFNGTSEDMGNLVKTAMKAGEDSGRKAIDTARKAYLKKGLTPAQAESALTKTSLFKNYMKEYKNQLAQKIIGTNKPEAIAGMLRSDAFANEDVRTFYSTLAEKNPQVLGAAQNRIMRDILSETLTKVKDPIAKGAPGLERKFGGDFWTITLNKIGEERLKAIYGEAGYKNIEDFTKVVGLIGRNQQGSSIGRFMNIMLFISPIRSGLSPKTITKTGILAATLNRTAKMITSTEGVELTNKYVRATIANSPRLINLAREEIGKFNERSDREFEEQEKMGEQEYLAEHSNNNKEKNK